MLKRNKRKIRVTFDETLIELLMYEIKSNDHLYGKNCFSHALNIIIADHMGLHHMKSVIDQSFKKRPKNSPINKKGIIY